MYKSIIKSQLVIDDNNIMWHHQSKQILIFGIPLILKEMISDEQDHINLHHSSSLNAYQGDKIGFKTSNKVTSSEDLEEIIDE